MIKILPNRCDYCGTCVAVCPVDCIEILEADINIDEDQCIDCNLCVDICPLDVLEGDHEK